MKKVEFVCLSSILRNGNQPQKSLKVCIFHWKSDKFCLVTPFAHTLSFLTVIKELNRLICNPEVDHPLRTDLAEEYVRDKAGFEKKAAEYTAKHAKRQ